MAAASRMPAGQDCIYSIVNRFKRGDFETRRSLHVSAGPKASGRGTEEGTRTLPFSPLDNLTEPNMSQRRRTTTTTDPRGSENTPPVGGKFPSIGGSRTQRANIKDKISQWEGKESTHPPSPSSPPGPTGAVKRTESLTKTKSTPCEDQRGAAYPETSHNPGRENISRLWGSRPCSPVRLEHTPAFRERADGKASQSQEEGESSSNAACKENQNPAGQENVGRVGGSRPCSPAESVDSNHSGKPRDKERGEGNCRGVVAPKEQNADGKESGTNKLRGASRPCSPAEVEHAAGTLKGCDGKPGQSGNNASCKENQPPVKENAGKLAAGPRAGGTPAEEAADQPTTGADQPTTGADQPTTGGTLKKSDGGRRTAPERGDQEKRAVFTLFRKLEQNAQNHSKTPAELGNYFCPPSRDRQVEAKRKEIESMISPCGDARDEGRRSGRPPQLHNNNTTELGSTPPINPVPKPQRTFQHPAAQPGGRNLPPLPSISPPPPTAAGGYKRPRGGRYRDTTNRKSYESEDLPESRDPQSGLLFSRRLSQEHHYEVIPDSSKENPYEDIEVDSQSSQQSLPSSPGADSNIKASRPGFFRQNSNRSFKLLDLRRVNQHQRSRSTGGLSPSSPPQLSPPSTPCGSPEGAASSWLPGDAYNRTFRRIPTVVLKINSIFEARIGKKHLRRVYHYAETSSGRVTDDNSDSESEVEERVKAERQRLVSVQSILSQPSQNQVHHNNGGSGGRPISLDKPLKQELLQRQLFEYFLVVSLHRPKAGGPYLPEVTQQFPVKLERSFKFMRETEDQLRIIPQFCFPDAKDWQPVESFPSEMFSFVLTGEDGSRRFGYCRRLLPSGRGKRLPEVYCIVSHLGCFNLFSKVLDEVERRRALSPALVQPFMRAIMEAQFPAPGRTITIKTFLPGSGTETMELCRPSDSRLEHVDFECLFSCLNPRLLFKVLGSLLLERRLIFTADKLSTLSQCCHAMVALLYPFVWQHTYIPVLPSAMLDIVCTPTPFIVGLLSSSLPQLTQLPLEEVLVVDLGNSRLLRQLEDEDTILPSKLQSALENVLERRKELANERGGDDSSSDSTVVSEAFVRFFVELVGHYPLFVVSDREDGYSSSSSSSPAACSSFRREGFCKSVSSKTTRRFLEVFMDTQMFGWFIQERELPRRVVRGLFEQRVQEYLESIRDNEHRRVNRFLKGLGNKMKFLSKK